MRIGPPSSRRSKVLPPLLCFQQKASGTLHQSSRGQMRVRPAERSVFFPRRWRDWFQCPIPSRQRALQSRPARESIRGGNKPTELMKQAEHCGRTAPRLIPRTTLSRIVESEYPWPRGSAAFHARPDRRIETAPSGSTRVAGSCIESQASPEVPVVAIRPQPAVGRSPARRTGSWPTRRSFALRRSLHREAFMATLMVAQSGPNPPSASTSRCFEHARSLSFPRVMRAQLTWTSSWGMPSLSGRWHPARTQLQPVPVPESAS